MAVHTVTCPQCRAPLRSSRPVPDNKMLRCPGCGVRFRAADEGLLRPTTFELDAPAPETVTASAAVPPSTQASAPTPSPTPPTARPSRALWPLLAAALVLGGGIGTVIGYLSHQPQPAPDAQPQAKDDPVAEARRLLEEERKKFAEERKKFEDARARLEKDRKQLDLDRRLQEGDAALARKNYAEAEQAFRKALELAPDDARALAGLADAKASAVAANRDKEDRERRITEVKRLSEQAREAQGKKQYVQAVRFLQAALQLDRTNGELAKALEDTRAALDADDVQKKKLADFQKHMDQAKAAMEVQAFADAVKELGTALELVPDDPDALNLKKLAEQQLVLVKDFEKKVAQHKELVQEASEAMTAKKYAEAVSALTKALKLFPDDKGSQKSLKAAKLALAGSKEAYAELMELAQVAMTARRFEEAHRLYTQALDFKPGDMTATEGQKAAAEALENIRAARAAYARFMRQGSDAMMLRRFADAAMAFKEALRVMPGDPTAARGLLDAQAGLVVAGPGPGANDYTAVMTAGTAALRTRQYADAVRIFGDALKLRPGDPDAINGLRQAKYGQAMADGQKALLARRAQDAIMFFEAALKEAPGDLAASAALRQAKALKK